MGGELNSESQQDKPADQNGKSHTPEANGCQKAFQRVRDVCRAAKRPGTRLYETVRRLVTSDGIAAIFTVVIAAATIWNVVVVKGSLAILQGQLNESIAEQRPWVYAEATAKSQIFVGEDGGYSFPIRFLLHNTGHLPAQYVWPYVQIFLLMGLDQNRKSIDTLQREVCEERRVQQRSWLTGNTVFPGQELAISVTPDRSVPRARWNAALQSIGGKAAMPIAVGCIDYQIPGENGKHHTTGFAFFVARKANAMDGFGPLPPDPTQVPADQLTFPNWPYGEEFQAN